MVNTLRNFSFTLGIITFLTLGSTAVAQYDPAERRCAELASSPADPERVGNGVPVDQIDVNQAAPACQEAAARQGSSARVHFTYGRVLEAAKRYDEAREQYMIAARAGHPIAMSNIGGLYTNGNGVPKDYQQAADWYRRGGQAGFADAYADLAALFVRSNPQNFVEAARWNQVAVDAGSAAGMASLGWQYQFAKGVPADLGRAIRLYTQASRQGNPEGMHLLGLLYLHGQGVRQDNAQAFGLFQTAAERGDTDAQAELASSYQRGRGVAANPEAAFAWYLKAAQGGRPDAQFWVAAMYEKGQGVAQSDPAAVAWYRKAAEQNDPDAMNQLAIRLRQGRGVAWNEAEAMQWFRKAANLGHVDAEAALGWGYMHGLGGGAQDYRAAASWFGKAANQGSGAAQINLGLLYEKGWGVNQDWDRARSLYMQAARNPYPEISKMAKTFLAGVPATTRPSPTATSKNSDDLIAGVVLAVGAIALVELLSGPSSSGSPSAVSSGVGTGTPMNDASQRILEDHIASEQRAREAAAEQRQKERDTFYHNQRCGTTPINVNCF